MAAILMRHPRAVARGRVDAASGSLFVTDIAARTTGHMVYLAPLRAADPIVSPGDTLAALRFLKNPFR
jgi:hypothetical protein